MDLILKRDKFTPEGIFGQLTGYGFTAYTIERNYNGYAKLPPGKYTCVRHAPNRLPYETFMVLNVPDFEGEPVTWLLIHIANYQKDVIGCIGIGKGLDLSQNMITESKDAFDELMLLQSSFDSFTLMVV